jgi:hypothetical protein
LSQAQSIPNLIPAEYEGMKAKFDKGERNIDFLADYLRVLKDGSMDYESVFNDYLKTLSPANLKDDKHAQSIYQFTNDLKSAGLPILMKNRAFYISKYGASNVENKLSGIETGAEVNNISEANATDLTDSGESSLHYHSSDRNRSNHTGTQSADTIVDGTTNKVYTSIEKTKLSNIESLADVTDATNVGNSIFNSPSKSTPVNNDILSLLNSESSNALSKFTVLNLKTLLKTYFDAYYENIGVCIPYSDATATPTANKIPIADSNKLIDNWISKTVVIQVSDPNGDAITSGDGKAFFTVPASLNGCNIIDADVSLTTASTSGTPTIQIRNVTDSQDVLSTRITVDANEKTSYTASTQPVINTSYDDVSTGDQLAVDIDVAGTGVKGLSVILIFKKA